MKMSHNIRIISIAVRFTTRPVYSDNNCTGNQSRGNVMIVRNIIVAVSLLAIQFEAAACVRGKDHDGIVPKNNLKISTAYFKPGQTMSVATFGKIIDGIAKIYSPIIASKGGRLKAIKDWENPEVNAYASRDNNNYIVHLYGGIARHPATTEDGFALVVCHEIGHHIGGYPKLVNEPDMEWASNEGQSDYFGTTKCLRKYFEALDNSAQVVSKMAVPELVQKKCFATWGQSSKDHAICVRTSLAGQSMGNLFAILNKEPNKKLIKPDFTTPIQSSSTVTYDDHPHAQCRLDTYFQASLCTVSHNIDLSDKDERVGACANYKQDGARSKCWFKPRFDGSQRVQSNRFANNRSGSGRNSSSTRGGFQGGRN